MKYLREYLKFLTIIIVISLLLGTLSFYYIIKENIVFMIQNIVVFIILFIIGYKLGKIKNKNGYLEGIKFGLLIDAFFIALTFFTNGHFTTQKFLYYILIIITTTIGGILGVNKKTKD